MNYFTAIISIIKLTDAESTYFSFYALLNFISVIEFTTANSAIEMAKMRLNQIDYQTLCGCLIKTGLLQAILI